MGKTVFISHSHKDASVAVLLRDALENSGIGCWICSKDINSGEIWDAEIVNAIEGCRVFLFLLSENSAKSKQCYKEIALADAANCAMICVNIDHSELSGGAKYHFINLQTVFLDQLKLSDELGGVVDRIHRLLGGAETSATGELIPCYDFEFCLDLKGKCHPLSAVQKLQIIEMMADKDKKFRLNIKLADENIKALESQCQQIKDRVGAGQDVSDEELHYMMQARVVCDRQRRENLRKAMAVKLFLYDGYTQSLCQLRRPEELFAVMKDMLEYQPRFDITKKANDRKTYSMLEFVCSNPSLYFSAPVRNDIIAERHAAMGYFCEIGLLPIADLGVQYFKELLTYFYMFLVEELAEGSEAAQQPAVRDLMKYRFGYK